MATIIQRAPLKNGETPYSVQVYSNGKFYNKTWRKPVGMKEYETKRKLDLFALQFEEDVHSNLQKVEQFKKEQLDNITFGEIAERWLKNSNHKNSKTSVVRNRKIVDDLKRFLGQIPLKRIKPADIEKILIYLNEKVVKREIAKLKKPIDEAISKVNTDKMCRENDFSTATVFYTRKGNSLLWETAEKLAKGLNINVNEYFEKIVNKKPYSKGSKLVYRRVLFAIFNYAIKLEYIEKNPARKIFVVSEISGEMPEKDTLNLEEINKLKIAIANEKDIRIKTMVAVLLSLGIRKGELCGLKWYDINFEDKTIYIQRSSSYCGAKFGMVTKKPKTKTSIRKLSLPINLVSIIQEYKVWYDNEKERLGMYWHNEDWVFVKNNGRQIDSGTPTYWLHKLLQKNNIRTVGCHSLRHTAITLLLRQKLSPKIVSEFAGHSNPSITLGIYSHVFDEDKKETANILNELLEV